LKRLIKKADAIRLETNEIPANIALNAIMQADQAFEVNNLKTDQGTANAIYGAIDDTIEFVAEAYSYTIKYNEAIKNKCAIVVDRIDENGSNLNQISVTLFDINGNSEIVQMFNTGITLANGLHLTFFNNFNNYASAKVELEEDVA